MARVVGGVLACGLYDQNAVVPAAVPVDRIRQVQSILGVEADGAFGRRSRAALHAALHATGQPPL